MREVEVVLVQQHVVRLDPQRHAAARPSRVREPWRLRRRAESGYSRLAEPEPDERRLLVDGERANAGATGDVLLRGHVDAGAVGVVGEPVIAAHEAIALEPTF